MAYSYDKKTGQITISGWEKGIAPSPYDGIGDLKGVNISSIKGEVSAAYNRVRQDNVPVSGGTMTNSGSSTTFAYSATNLTNGTWIKVTAHTGNPGTTDNHYYFAVVNVVGVSYFLYSDMGVTQITSGAGASTITFTTVDMGTPIDYAVEQSTSGSTYRYYILDANGIIWANGTNSVIATSFISGGITSSTTWQAITPSGTSLNAVDTFSTTVPQGSIQVMYATNSSNVIQGSYLLAFTTSQIKYAKNSTAWPSVGGSAFTVWKSLNYSGVQHKSILGNDQVIYFGDGPGVGIIQQKTGQVFDPTSATTYNYVNANYLMAPTDTATQVAMIPQGNGLSIVVGGQQNNLYVYPSYQNSTASGAAPTTLLWMPESNTQKLLATNNYVLIFCGNKGNIYLTNGSSVVPILTVPDYIPGAANVLTNGTTGAATGNFVQDPYFVWGGAMYLRGRVFLSIKDQTASHTGNAGGIWSFVPSFSYYPNQDSGLSLRCEGASSQYATHGWNGIAWILFAGQEIIAQQADGPQYIAGWSQTTGATTTNFIDFSGTTPITNSSMIIETDAIPVGTFLEKKTFQQLEVKLSSALATGETITPYYRTDLEANWSSSGTFVYETDKLSGIVQGVPFQKSQILQLRFVCNSTASSPSWIRIKEFYIR